MSIYDQITSPSRPVATKMSLAMAKDIARRLPEVVQIILQQDPLNAGVGGGFIRYALGYENVLNDIDIFFTNEGSRTIADKILRHAGYRKTVSTANAFTYTKENETKIQLVGRWYYPLDEHIERFDFTICQACIFYTQNKVWGGYAGDTFHEDCRAKELKYTQPEREEEVLSSMRRALRFTARGYELPVEDLGLLQMQINKRLTDVEFLEDRQTWLTLSARAGGDY